MINKLLPHDTLNHQLWGDDKVLSSAVREKLVLAAKNFKDYFKLAETHLQDKVKVVDIRLTGSLANYNWSEYSDIDLHLVIDYTNVSSEEQALIERYLQARKALWNAEHNITIYGFEIEVYPEDVTEEHFATGIYSIAENKWLHEPVHRSPAVDKRLVSKKVKGLMRIIDALAKEPMEPSDMLKAIRILKDKIKKMRQAGLSKQGEYSVANLVFKVLRRIGYIESLYDLATNVYDKAVSLEQQELHEQHYSELKYNIEDEGMFQAAYFPEFGKSALKWRTKNYPHVSDTPVYQMHIDVDPEYQGKGIAAKMIKAFLSREGGQAYFSHGRIINPAVYKVFDKIKQDADFVVEDIEDYGILIYEG